MNRLLLILSTDLIGKILFYLILLCILVDSISGFFLLSIGFDTKLSLLFKLLILLLALFYIAKSSLQAIFFIFGCLIWLFFVVITNLFLHSSISLTIDFTLAFKILAFPILFSYAFFLQKNIGSNYFSYVNAVLLFGYFVVVLNVVSGYFGLGYRTYESSQVGFKGYFFAGNELSAVFMVFSTYVIQRAVVQSGILFLSLTLLNIFVGFSIGTKSGMIYSILSPLAIYLIYNRNNFSKLILSILVFFVTIFIVYFYFYSHVVEFNSIEKIAFNLTSGGVYRLFFSGRDEWLLTIINDFPDDHWVYHYIFGYGSEFIENSIGKGIVEIDPVDIYLLFGVLPLLAFMTFSIFSILIPFWCINGVHAPGILVLNIALFLFAIIAGHVWTSGMLPFAWAMYFFLCIKSEGQYK